MDEMNNLILAHLELISVKLNIKEDEILKAYKNIIDYDNEFKP